MLRQLRAILVLPFTVMAVIPAILLRFDGCHLPDPGSWRWPVAALPALGGLALLAVTVRLLIVAGRGTLAPWDPPRKLVISGPYAFVRNPMLTGVFLVLLGEAIFFGSWLVGGWFGFFIILNLIYFPLVEEPGLRRRFGAEYEEYCRHVPRCVPRLTPWRPDRNQEKPS